MVKLVCVLFLFTIVSLAFVKAADEEITPFSLNDCTQNVEFGDFKCMAFINVFKWDAEKQDCVPAVYGGCRASRNNFATIEECKTTAKSICATVEATAEATA